MPRRALPALPLAASSLLLALCFVTTAPVAADDGLFLHGERFHVTAEWRAPDGSSGIGHPVALTQETGLFWFFSSTNLELMVKVLDACPLFQRYWVFASGLTDVEVTLTVEDRWSGAVQRYQRAGGALFAPLADTTSFDACSTTAPACGHGNPVEMLASPRPDEAAEALALLLGDDVAADEALYQRLHADLDAIRAADPELADLAFYNIWWGERPGVIMSFTAEAWAAVRAGAYHEWDCLNAWYRGSIGTIGQYDFSRWASLRFAGALRPSHVAADYAALPGVTSASVNGLGYPACEGCVPRWGMCAISADGTAYDYFVDESRTGYPNGPVPVRYYRSAAPGAAPVPIGRWNPGEPPPAWQGALDQCYARLDDRIVGR